MKRYGMMFIGLVVGAATINSCSSVPEDNLYRCDPNAIVPNPRCLKQALTDADAGTGGAGGTGGESAASLMPPDAASNDAAAACAGVCKPRPSDTSAGAWNDEPVLVWFGPAADMPTKCDDPVPQMKWSYFDKLVAPPAQCDACACVPDGTCTGLPASIEIRAGLCNVSNVQTTPFNGPADWTGTCTSDNAMPAGTMCNGVPCAQSVSASPLPGPINETCTATADKPNATIAKHTWLEGALVCSSKDLDGACPDALEHCRPWLPPPWAYCVAREGIHQECPANYAEGPRWFYDDKPLDDRGCAECKCGEATGGVCGASLRVSSDDACQAQFFQLDVSSIKDACGDLAFPGKAVGSKSITGLSYVPGSCGVTGGEPIGIAAPDSKEETSVTICCRTADPPQKDVPW